MTDTSAQLERIVDLVETASAKLVEVAPGAFEKLVAYEQTKALLALAIPACTFVLFGTIGFVLHRKVPRSEWDSGSLKVGITIAAWAFTFISILILFINLHGNNLTNYLNPEVAAVKALLE